MPTLPDLTAAAADLRLHLGDFHARHRADGVFYVAPGGPGSVPTLADLDVPELHVDLLPETPDPAAQAVLRALGYVPGPDGWAHPGGWRLVFPAHDSGWRARQQALRALLRADPAAAAQYRQVYRAAGREAADQALAEPASARHAGVVGWAPLAFVADALRGLEAPWMFAAGAAMDLHLGRVARPHDDLDVVLPYEAQDAVRAQLHARGWRTDAVLDGQYAAWDAPVLPPHHQVHARHPALPDVLMLDLMFTDLSGGTWHYRRDPAVTRPLAEVRRVDGRGWPFLAPEVALLFKAGMPGRPPRPKDEADFRRVAPTLDPVARAWLRGTLDRVVPGHPWQAAL